MENFYYVVSTKNSANETAQCSTRWVTPSPDLCKDRQLQQSCCKTLSHYRDNNMLNHSNVKWIFIANKVPHNLLGGLYVFDNVNNVSLVCEDEDYQGKCRLNCNLSNSRLCTFLFLNATNVSITRFKVKYNTSYTHPIEMQDIQKYLPTMVSNSSIYCVGNDWKKCGFNFSIAYRSWVFVDSTNINVTRVRFIGPQNSWAVLRPRGTFTVKNCSFMELSSGISKYDKLETSIEQHHIVVVVAPPMQDLNNSLVFTIVNTWFQGIKYLPVNPINGSNYPIIHIISTPSRVRWKANLTINNCEFNRCPALKVSATESSGFFVKMKNCKIDGNVSTTLARKWLRTHRKIFYGSAVHLQLRNYFMHKEKRTCSNIPFREGTEPAIDIVGNTFTNLASALGSAILLRSKSSTACSFGIVTVRDNQFISNHGIWFRSVAYFRESLVGHRVARKSGYDTTSDRYRLVLRSNTFSNNFKESRIDRHCVIYNRSLEIPNYVLQIQRVPFLYKYQQSCYWHAVIYLSGYTQHIRSLMEDNVIDSNYEGGLKLRDSAVQFRGRNTISKCVAYYGAGIRMIGDSQLLLEEDAVLVISNNEVYVRGGGIFIMDKCAIYHLPSDTCACFFQFVRRNGTLVNRSLIYGINTSVVVNGNSQIDSGYNEAVMIFNSNIDQCFFLDDTNLTDVRNTTTLPVPQKSNIQVFQAVFNLIDGHTYTSREISSIPRKICICGENGVIITCDLAGQQPLRYYPGQRLKVNIALLGDMNIPLNSILYIDLDRDTQHEDTEIFVPLNLHSIHILENKCNALVIPPLPNNETTTTTTTNRTVTFYLRLRVSVLHDTFMQETDVMYLTGVIKTKQHTNPVCPDGFFLGQHVCQCHPKLIHHGFNCSLDDLAFILPQNQSAWIGKRTGQSQLSWSLHCPHIYCHSSTLAHMQVHIDDYHVQCKYNRIGVLCGQCPRNYSVVFFSKACEICKNWSLLTLTVLLIAGPILVIIIGVLNITISVGPINGYMYYATIITINSDFNFEIPSELRICLYDGMDEFGKTLTVYVFPLYLLLLVAIACCLPRCRRINMHKINKKIGPRITPVLATIITISYLIIFYTVIKSLRPVPVYSIDGSVTYVWLRDGSLKYFRSIKHIILGCIAITMFLVLLLPAALTATFGDLFRRFIKGPWYLNFLDTFHGAFRFRFGFWFGVRLLILTVIMILKVVVETKNVQLAVVCMSTIILLFQMIVQPYRGMRIKECVTRAIKEKYFSERMQRIITNLLDNLFQINLMVFFACVLYSPHNHTAALVTSLLIAHIEFAIILIYHLLEYTPLGQLVIELRIATKRKYNRWKEARLLKAIQNRNKPQEEPDSVQTVEFELRLEDCWKDDDDDDVDSDESNQSDGNSNSDDSSNAVTEKSDKNGKHSVSTTQADISHSDPLQTPLLSKITPCT